MKMFDAYKEFVLKNKNAKPSVQLIPIPEKQYSFQYVGGQIYENKLYSIVNSAEKMLTYDINKDDFSFLGQFEKTDFKWTGGCVFKDVLYLFPRSSKCLLAYHLKTCAFENIDCGFLYEGEHHYGGVCTPNGFVYQPPRNTDHILKWDLKNKSCEKIVISEGDKFRYCGSVLHPNGFLYFFPEQDLPIIKMNVKTHSITLIDCPKECFTFDPTIAADGNIYAFSARKGIIKIDTKTDTVSVFYGERRMGAYGTKAGVNGKLYSLPGYTNEMLEFDPFTGELKECFSMSQKRKVHYAGGAVDVNGDIYALPVHADEILKISFDDFTDEIPKDLYAFFNDCY